MIVVVCAVLSAGCTSHAGWARRCTIKFKLNETELESQRLREALKTIAKGEAWLDEESRTAMERSEKIKVLEEKVDSEPKNWVSLFALAEFLYKYWAHPGNGFAEEYRGLRGKAQQCYLRAIALGIPDPVCCASAKLRYAILLGQGSESCTRPGQDRIKHYAREAEKDLRKRLREYPDDISTLKKLAQAVGLYEESDRVRGERLAAIDARIAEAEIRREMRTAPSSKLSQPGEPESPYPENWNELSNAAKRRDGYKCTDCGASGVELHVHHIVPLSKGGTNDLDNLTTLCSHCHSMIHPRMVDTP